VLDASLFILFTVIFAAVMLILKRTFGNE